MLDRLFYFIVLIGVLIFIHEMGHFLFAKLFNVKVLKFSLGFGPRLFGFRKGETDYCVSAFPLGGYVKMLGEDPSEEVSPADRGRAFGDKKLLQRFLIVFGGPAFNLLLPILIYFIFFAAQTQLLPSSVGTVLVGMPAWEAGLRPGDKVVSLNGASIRYWEQVQETIAASPGVPMRLLVERRGKLQPEMNITPRAVTMPNKLGMDEIVGQIGVTANYQGTRIGVSDPDSPAARAGLRTWDEVVAVDGKKVERWTDLEAVLFSARTGPAGAPGAPEATRKVTVLRPVDAASKFVTAQTLEPVQVEVAPEPAGAAMAGLLERLAAGLDRVSERFGRWLGGAEPARPAERAKAALGTVAATLGLGQAVDAVRAVSPGAAGLARQVEAAARRLAGDDALGAGALLRTPALAVGDFLQGAERALRQELAWPVLHGLSRVMTRFAFHGVEQSEFYVHEVQPGSPAEAIGMKKGDRVVSLNGEGLTLWGEIDQLRRQFPTAQMQIAFVQQGELQTRSFRQLKKVIIDEYKNEIEQYIFGARAQGSSVTDDKVDNTERFGRAAKRAVLQTGEVIGLTALGIVRLVQGKISFKTVGGPVMIFDIAGKAGKKGWESFLWLMALISVNLGLLNLLPIPVLDGGHLVFIAIEAIKRKPVSMRAREIAGLVGFSLLILLMIFAFKNDIERYWKDIVDVFR